MEYFDDAPEQRLEGKGGMVDNDGGSEFTSEDIDIVMFTIMQPPRASTQNAMHLLTWSFFLTRHAHLAVCSVMMLQV